MAKNLKIIPFRLSEEMYRELRKYAFLHEISMAQIVRDAVEKVLIENRKMLTNSDIAI